MNPCTHGMPDPRSCFECMEDGNLPAPQKAAPPTPSDRTHPARFDGECSGCGFVITAGQLIRHWSDGQWRHAECSP